MFYQSPRRWSAIVLGLSLLVPATAAAAPIQFTASGATAGDILATVNAFRAAIGDPINGNNPGPLPGGRREINWDGGGAVTPSPAGTPFTGFENTRGATFTTDGTGFLQASPDDLATAFGQGDYATDFVTFSQFRLFTPVGSNITDADFSLPGTDGSQDATTRAFGAVFTDVDLADTTMIEFFDFGGALLTTISAPVFDGGLSFAGVIFNAGEQVGRVRITTGNAALGVADNPGQGVDVVAMDDFIYAEPTAVPEPATILLSGLGLVGVCGRAIRRLAVRR
jgi:PEP-CTERM motif